MCFAMELPNYMQMPGVARSLGADVSHLPPAYRRADGNQTGTSSIGLSPARPRLVYISNPNNPTGSVLVRCRDGTHRGADARLPVRGCCPTRCISARRSTGPRTKSFWGMSDRVIVTSGLSKAYGIPGVRIGWIVAPASLTEQCWTQHDYLTIGPNKMSDRIARVAVERIESRAMLRADARDTHSQSADRARMDRKL